jgi:hypothetical protein
MSRKRAKKRIFEAVTAAAAVGTVHVLLFAVTWAAPTQETDASAPASAVATQKTDVSAPASTEAAAAEASPPGMKLEGGADGTVFGRLTITGEDRISIEFERPELSLDLEPRDAPGIEWGDPLGVLQRSGIDRAAPFLEASTTIRSYGLADEWVTVFRDDAVARFRPQLEDVESWQLTIVDSRSDTVAVFAGRGEPPKEIAWDGMRLDGEPASPGLVYSYVLEASDKAGNRRTFPGEGFELPPYRCSENARVVHLFAANSLPAGWAARPSGPPPALLLEVASRINRGRADAPVEVRVGARTFTEANALADAVGGVLRTRLLGDPARVRAVADVRPDAPEGGTVAVVSSLAARES